MALYNFFSGVPVDAIPLKSPCKECGFKNQQCQIGCSDYVEWRHQEKLRNKRLIRLKRRGY